MVAQDPYYTLNRYFMSIYTSEYNRESWETLAYEMSWTQFMEHANRIIETSELKIAMEDDAHRAQNGNG